MYEAYFGLRGKPFQLNPDPSFFYGSRGHRRAMAYLEYGLHQNEGFIVITGEIGAGKTLLVRSLLEKLDSQKIVAANLVSTQIDADDILRLVAAAFGIPSKHLAKSDLLLAIEAFLVAPRQPAPAPPLYRPAGAADQQPGMPHLLRHSRPVRQPVSA